VPICGSLSSLVCGHGPGSPGPWCSWCAR